MCTYCLLCIYNPLPRPHFFCGVLFFFFEGPRGGARSQRQRIAQLGRPWPLVVLCVIAPRLEQGRGDQRRIKT
jgi:hypothetical protein